MKNSKNINSSWQSSMAFVLGQDIFIWMKKEQTSVRNKVHPKGQKWCELTMIIYAHS